MLLRVAQSRRFGTTGAKFTRLLSSSSSSSSSSSPSPPSPGLFQNPIVEHLWSTRHASSPSHEAYSEAVPRPPSLSSSSVLYTFSTDPVLKETYKSPWGEVRLGKILEGESMSLISSYVKSHLPIPPPFLTAQKSPPSRLASLVIDLDAIAGNVAYSHCVKGGSWPTPLLVTAGVDSIQLCPDGTRADVERDMLLTGAVQWVGSSSLSLTMSCRSEGR